MIYKSLNKDFFYEDSGSTRLSYYLTCGDETIYTGRAYNPNGIKINLRKIIEDWLWNDMPDFREYDGVIVTHEDACKVFTLFNDEGTQLEEYKVLLAYEDWQGEDEILSEQINGNVDPRQKIFWCARLSRSEVVPIKREVLNLEIEFSDELHFGPQSGSTTICYTANTYVEISTDSDWFTFEHVPNEEGGCIIFTYTENTDTANTRDANICFTYTAFTGQQVSCFKVTQDEAYWFSVPSSLTENYTGHYVTIPYSTNIPNIASSITVSFSPSGIASFSSASQTGCTIYLNQNTSDTPRTITVTYTTIAGTYTTSILQERLVRYYTLASLPTQNLTGDTVVTINVDTNYTTSMIESLTYSTSDPEGATITGTSRTAVAVFCTLPPEGECDDITIYVHSGNTLVDSTDITICNNYEYPSDMTRGYMFEVPWYETDFTIPAGVLTNCLKNVRLSGYTQELVGELGVLNLLFTEDIELYNTFDYNYGPSVQDGPPMSIFRGYTGVGQGATAVTPTLITSGAFNQYGDFVMTLTQNTVNAPRVMGMKFVADNNVVIYISILQYEKPGAATKAIIRERYSVFRYNTAYGVWERMGYQAGTYHKGVLAALTQGNTTEAASSTGSLTISKTRYTPLTGLTIGDHSLDITYGNLTYSNGSYTGEFYLKNAGALPKLFTVNLDLVDTATTLDTSLKTHPASGGTIVFIQEPPSTPGSGTTFPVRIARNTRASVSPSGAMYGHLFADQTFYYSGSTVALRAPERVYYKSDKFVVSYPVSKIKGVMFSKCLLEYIGIPEGVKELVPYDYSTDHSQQGCLEKSMYLKEVDLPSTITLMRNTFRNCPRLTRINYNGTMAQWNAITKSDWHYGSPNIVVYCTDGNITP